MDEKQWVKNSKKETTGAWVEHQQPKLKLRETGTKRNRSSGEIKSLVLRLFFSGSQRAFSCAFSQACKQKLCLTTHSRQNRKRKTNGERKTTKNHPGNFFLARSARFYRGLYMELVRPPRTLFRSFPSVLVCANRVRPKRPPYRQPGREGKV